MKSGDILFVKNTFSWCGAASKTLRFELYYKAVDHIEKYYTNDQIIAKEKFAIFLITEQQIWYCFKGPMI